MWPFVESNNFPGILFPCFAILDCEPIFRGALSVGIPTNMKLGSRGYSFKEFLCLFLLHAERYYQHRRTFYVNYKTFYSCLRDSRTLQIV